MIVDAIMIDIELTRKGEMVYNLNQYKDDLSFNYVILNLDYFNFKDNKFNEYSFNNIFYVELDNKQTLLVSPVLYYYLSDKSNIFNLYIDYRNHIYLPRFIFKEIDSIGQHSINKTINDYRIRVSESGFELRRREIVDNIKRSIINLCLELARDGLVKTNNTLGV